MGWFTKTFLNPMYKGVKAVGGLMQKGYRGASKFAHKAAGVVDTVAKKVEDVAGLVKKIPIVGAAAAPIADAVTGVIGVGRGLVKGVGALEKQIVTAVNSGAASDYAKGLYKRIKGMDDASARKTIETELRKLGKTAGIDEVRKRRAELSAILRKAA